MTVGFLNLVKAEVIRRHGRITAAGVERIVRQAQDEFKVDKKERQWLSDLLTQDVFDTPATRARLEDAVHALPALPDMRNEVAGLVEGRFTSHMNDDEMYLGRDGVVTLDSGSKPFTRSYLPIFQGPLRARLGSLPPSSSALSPAEVAAVRSRTPGQSLNAAAAARGVQLPDMDALFNSRRFFNPSAQSWEGACHSWTPLSLHPRLSRLVDVEGPQGARGIWYADQFFSRADLGNLAMALGDTITSHPETREMGDNFVNTLDVLKAAQLYLGNRRQGYQADVWNDVVQGSAQVWNQPFTHATLQTTTLQGPAAAAVLAVAAGDFAVADKAALEAGTARVKLVVLTGTYGKEVGDDWEGEPATESRTWNMYAVTDEDGRVLNAYNADDPRLRSAPLPIHESAELPDFLVKPDLRFVDDAFEGRPNAVVDRDPNGAAFRFLLAEVLTKGVTAQARAAFERDVAALPPGNISAANAEALAARHPGIAHGYSQATWARVFGNRGLSAGDFTA